MSTIADYSSFAALDIRVGRVLEVTPGEKTREPTYRMLIDFGPEIGRKVSCGKFRKYAEAELVGKAVIAIVNFAPLKMGPVERSEVLVLGVPDAGGGTTYLTPESEVSLGVKVF